MHDFRFGRHWLHRTAKFQRAMVRKGILEKVPDAAITPGHAAIGVPIRSREVKLVPHPKALAAAQTSERPAKPKRRRRAVASPSGPASLKW